MRFVNFNARGGNGTINDFLMYKSNLFETDDLVKRFGEEGFMAELFESSIRVDDEKFDRTFSGFMTRAFFCNGGATSNNALELILRQVYVKPMFVLATTWDNRYSPIIPSNQTYSYLVTHDSSMFADHNIGKTRRSCVPYTKQDFMLIKDAMMGIEGNYTTPEKMRFDNIGLVLFYSSDFVSDIIAIANNYYKKTLSDTFTSTLSLFNSFLLGVAFIYPATMPLSKNYVASTMLHS